MTAILYTVAAALGAYAIVFAYLLVKYRDREQLWVGVLHFASRVVAAFAALWGAVNPGSRNAAIWVLVGALVADQVLKAAVRWRMRDDVA